MPHGLKEDRAVTRLARQNLLIQDPGSFISLADPRGRVHIHCEGFDRSKVRAAAFLKQKEKCAVCGRQLDPIKFELHHPAACDCLDPSCPDHVEARCGQWDSLCHRHHTADFSRRASG
jgi:hypothetical protein